jgi:hypothetical protein
VRIDAARERDELRTAHGEIAASLRARMNRAERDLDAARETEATLRQAEAQLRAELERARKSKS